MQLSKYPKKGRSHMLEEFETQWDRLKGLKRRWTNWANAQVKSLSAKKDEFLNKVPGSNGSARAVATEKVDSTPEHVAPGETAAASSEENRRAPESTRTRTAKAKPSERNVASP